MIFDRYVQGSDAIRMVSRPLLDKATKNNICLDFHLLLAPFIPTYPKQISGNVSFVVSQSSPPPLSFVLIALPQYSQLLTRCEGQFIRLLSRVIKNSVHCSTVQDSQFLLHA